MLAASNAGSLALALASLHEHCFFLKCQHTNTRTRRESRQAARRRRTEHAWVTLAGRTVLSEELPAMHHRLSTQSRGNVVRQ